MKLQIPYFAVNRLDGTHGICSVCKKTGTDIYQLETEVFYPVFPKVERSIPVFICQQCLPGTQTYFEIIHECFNSLEHFWPSASRRWVENDQMVNFYHVDWDIVLPITIAQLLYDARAGFIFGLFASSIVNISAVVELAINTDTRITGAWKNLNMNVLKMAQENGINVQDLLEENETLSGEKIRFLCRRNKYAHGDVREWKTNENPLISTEFMERESLAQLIRGQEFINVWAKSDGNPAVHQPKDNHNKNLMLKASSDTLNLSFYNPYSR